MVSPNIPQPLSAATVTVVAATPSLLARTKTDSKRMQMVDIARLAGVSTSTVSRALAGNSLIKQETRERITELARSLNYAVNYSAKNLRMGDNRTIGVVIPYDTKTRQHISDPFFLGMLGSLADALTEQHYDMLLSRVDAEHLDEVAKLYETGRVKGIIVIGQWGHHDQLNELAMRRIPFVVWGAQLPGQMYCSVGSNNRTGGQMATQHLLAAGCQRIAFFGDTSLPEVAHRYEGYVMAHQQAKREVDPLLQAKTPFSAELAQTAIQTFMQQAHPFDAIFAASDLIAIKAMGVLGAMGLDVPGDVSVVGYDDIAVSAHCHPPLTTIKQTVDIAGAEMVDCLQKILAGFRPESRVLQTVLTVRQSTR